MTNFARSGESAWLAVVEWCAGGIFCRKSTGPSASALFSCKQTNDRWDAFNRFPGRGYHLACFPILRTDLMAHLAFRQTRSGNAGREIF